jgi:putative oxidoreductase
MKKYILIILSALLGLLLINSGLNKFFMYLPVPDDLPEKLVRVNEAIMQIEWLIPLVGAAEIVGGFFLLFPRTRALGLLIVFPVMVGVLLTHLYYAPSGIPMIVIIWVIMLWILWEDRKKFRYLLR